VSSPAEWVRLPVTPAMRERGLARSLENDRASDDERLTRVRRAGTREATARGYVAEEALVSWLRGRGARVTAHGGFDGLPDLEVEGRGLGVKFRIRRAPAQPHYTVCVFEQHLGTAPEFAFTTNIPGADDELLLLGTATRDELLAGKRLDVGDREGPAFVAVAPMYLVTIAELEPPARWLFSRVAAAA
jgi:hypothetical protein